MQHNIQIKANHISPYFWMIGTSAKEAAATEFMVFHIAFCWQGAFIFYILSIYSGYIQYMYKVRMQMAVILEWQLDLLHHLLP